MPLCVSSLYIQSQVRSVVLVDLTVGSQKWVVLSEMISSFFPHPGMANPYQLGWNDLKRKQNWALQRDVAWVSCTPLGVWGRHTWGELWIASTRMCKGHCGKVNAGTAPCSRALKGAGRNCGREGTMVCPGVSIPARKLSMKHERQWRCRPVSVNYRTAALHFILNGILFLCH